jgi:hypothetical protein
MSPRRATSTGFWWTAYGSGCPRRRRPARDPTIARLRARCQPDRQREYGVACSLVKALPVVPRLSAAAINPLIPVPQRADEDDIEEATFPETVWGEFPQDRRITRALSGDGRQMRHPGQHLATAWPCSATPAVPMRCRCVLAPAGPTTSLKCSHPRAAWLPAARRARAAALSSGGSYHGGGQGRLGDATTSGFCTPRFGSRTGKFSGSARGPPGLPAGPVRSVCYGPVRPGG